jgi:aminopeptidase N
MGKIISFIGSVCYFIHASTVAQVGIIDTNPDVTKYRVSLEPNIADHSIQGNVIIDFQIDVHTSQVIFDAGGLHVTRIKGDSFERYKQKDQKVIINLKEREVNHVSLQLFYNGVPTRGVSFPEDGGAYTTFFTSEWMVCNTNPADRAKFELSLSIPDSNRCIASGELQKKVTDGNKVTYHWSQDNETPTYVYGFVIGYFHEFKQQYQGISLNYYSQQHQAAELEKIFRNTPDMIRFFEEKSGVAYIQDSYSQILIGNNYQEMAGFSMLKSTYGELVLKDSTEMNLISHELAHQWWGNMITCENWNNFWLNEGFATFMSAAYNESRFGAEKYKADIDAYRNVYAKIKDRGSDKSLIFEDWSHPSSDDRNLVYFKGAYALHMLRVHLGDDLFWGGIKYYSKMYFGKSVTTRQFQKAMEESTSQSLEEFFNHWIYME